MLSSGGSKASVSEGVEASILYVRFKAAASEVSFFIVPPVWISEKKSLHGTVKQNDNEIL